MQPPIIPMSKTDGGFSEVSLVGETTPVAKPTGKLLLLYETISACSSP